MTTPTDLSLVLFDDLMEELFRRYDSVIVAVCRDPMTDLRSTVVAHHGDLLHTLGLCQIGITTVMQRMQDATRDGPSRGD